MTKHTPGPWKVNPNAGEVRGADWNIIVADVPHDADAHLIAAAPDLLAVLEELLHELQCRCDVAFTSRGKHQPNMLCHHKDNVEAAVAKARGSQ